MTNFFSSSWTFKFYFLVTYGHRTSHKTPSIECLLKSHLYKNPHKIFTIFLDFINIKLHLYILAPTAVVSPLIWLEINVVIKKVVFILPAYLLLCVWIDLYNFLGRHRKVSKISCMHTSWGKKLVVDDSVGKNAYAKSPTIHPPTKF